MVIFAISPEYLVALDKEAKDYNFDLLGYGNFADAKNGLRTVNSREISGYLYLATSLTKEKGLEDFLALCNIQCKYKPRKFIICVKEAKNLFKQIDFSKYKNLQFKLVRFGSYGVSDTLINRELFGSLLLSVSPVYEFKEKQAKPLSMLSATKKYSALFPKEVMEIFSPPVALDNLNLVLRNDEIYQHLQKVDAFYALARCCYLKLLLHEPITEQLNQLRNIAESSTNPSLYSTQQALIYILQKGVD